MFITTGSWRDRWTALALALALTTLHGKECVMQPKKRRKETTSIPFYYVIEIYKVIYIIVPRYLKRGIFLFHSVRQCNLCCATCLHLQGDHPWCQIISGFVHEKYGGKENKLDYANMSGSRTYSIKAGQTRRRSHTTRHQPSEPNTSLIWNN